MRTTITAAGAAIAMAFAGPALAQQSAGHVTAIQPDGFQAQSGTGVELDRGDDIFKSARVYTREYGTVEIALDDGTDLTIAPNASITIDDFVFSDGGSGVGLNLLRGAIRMTSGRLAKEDYAVATPVATIGIRGTDFWLNAAGEKLQIWVMEGAVAATTNQSGTEFVFEAPAYAECSATDCQRGDAPPIPVVNPLDPSSGASMGEVETEESSGSFNDF